MGAKLEVVPDIVIHASPRPCTSGWHGFWNTRWRRSAAAGLRGWERTAILLPLALHAWLLYGGVFSRELRFGFAQALSMMMFLGVALYWFEPLLQRRRHAAARAAARRARRAAARALPGLALAGTHAQATEFKLHLGLAMVAYGLFVIALLHATLMALAERELHRRGRWRSPTCRRSSRSRRCSFA